VRVGEPGRAYDARVPDRVVDPVRGRRRERREGVVNVLANDQYQWFWWLAPILVVSALAVIGLLSAGYVRKVLIPRVKGRRVE
jgi:hypothetical protein